MPSKNHKVAKPISTIAPPGVVCDVEGERGVGVTQIIKRYVAVEFMVSGPHLHAKVTDSGTDETLPFGVLQAMSQNAAAHIRITEVMENSEQEHEIVAPRERELADVVLPDADVGVSPELLFGHFSPVFVDLDGVYFGEERSEPGSEITFGAPDVECGVGGQILFQKEVGKVANPMFRTASPAAIEPLALHAKHGRMVA